MYFLMRNEAGDYLMGIIKTVKLPRKLKVGFSNSPANVTHATFQRSWICSKRRTELLMYTVQVDWEIITAWE